MSDSYKPAGHTSVAPYLLVKSAAATIDFLARATQKGDEDKRGGVKDSDGISWWMATRMR